MVQYRLHDSSTKTYRLTVHSAVDSAPYTCLTDGKTTSSMTQYVLIVDDKCIIILVAHAYTH